MPLHRQLSAILFTDIEGYTAIMEESEQRALKLKDRHREILQKAHEQFNGRIIQYYGDGTLSTFQSVIEAVHCALCMQQQYRHVPEVPVRMGLHVGDIVFNEEFIFGDGVNLASRIESLGVPGSVLISDIILGGNSRKLGGLTMCSGGITAGAARVAKVMSAAEKLSPIK